VKALVLAGGSGTRLRPVSYSMPKQLVPIANKPVLEHVLDNIRALGVTEIGVIVGSQGTEIIKAIGDGSRFGARITYIPQDKPLGLAHCVTLARAFLGGDDFVMYLGDTMLPEGVVEVAEEFRAGRPAAQVVVHEVPDPRAFGVVELDRSGRVERLVEKPQLPRSDLALVGVYFFTPAIHEAVSAIRPSNRGELEITDAVQWLLTNGAEVKASTYLGYWKDTGRAEDVLDCNRRLLRELRGDVAGEIDARSILDGEVVVEPGARVVRSHIEGPVIVGAHSVVENCRIGPNTSVGTDCVLRASGVSDSIVLDGAAILGVPALHGSLIGRRATVGLGTRDGVHRLVVGDHTRIEFAA
jgi:glucose-1-phosphate thymidylyltransferase